MDKGRATLEGRTVGVLSALVTGTYFGTLLSAIADESSASGGRALAIQTQEAAWAGPFEHAPHYSARAAWQRVDGWVVIVDSVPRRHIESLLALGKPVVLISRQEHGLPCPVVMPDNRQGAEQAVQHLLAHGHERVAFVGDLNQCDIRERYEAYSACLRANGLDADPDLVFQTTNNHAPGGHHAARAMLAAGVRCTAVVAATDYNAVGLLEVFKEGGYEVPRDVAVVSFDDMPGADLQDPALSSVGHNLARVGAKAVEVVGRHLSGELVEPARYYVPAFFVARESCGCVATPGKFPRRGPAPDGPAAARSRSSPSTGARPGTGRSGAPSYEARADFVQGVVDVLGSEADERVRRDLEALAEGIADIFCRAAVTDPSPADLLQLGQICQRLHGLEPSRMVFGALGVARKFARHLERQAAVPAPGADSQDSRASVAERMDQCLQQMSAGFYKAGALEQLRLNEAYHVSVWNEYFISMELLRSHEKDPRDLDWMAKTVAREAVLALWSTGGGQPELVVAGTYHADGNRAAAARGQRFDPEQFPPAELLQRCSQEPAGSLLLVLPVRTTASDWGFLAVVAPPGAMLTRHERYFEWSALLGQALEYDAVTQSLRQRNDELALSYEREREMAKAIRRSEERYAIAAKAANDGLWDWDLTEGTIYFSPRWKEVLGYTEDQVGDSPAEWFDRVHAEDRPGLLAALAENRRGGSEPFEVEFRIRCSDGTYRWALCRGLGVTGAGKSPLRLVGSLTDVTERRQLEEQLVHQALYDNLTQLPNRALFLDRLSQSLAYARRVPGYEYAVLWLDLDGFKVVNDSLGHMVGDTLLVRVAERVKSHLREADTAARFGGDEFAVLLHEVPDFAAVKAIVTRLQEDLSRPYELNGQDVVVTASIGIATGKSGYHKPDEVLRDADIAMYQAKSRGRARWAVFDESMYEEAMSRLQTETALRQAIELGQLEIHYQPIVKLSDGALDAMEALVRWRHPTRGLLAPGEFLGVAEESGLVVPLGRWVQAEACRQLAQWKSTGLVPASLRVSVNVSNREFWNPCLLEQVDGALAESGAPPNWLTLEITEGVIMHNLDQALQVLGELHARGVQIHIDDFGTGYSSLEALHRLPIDALKIDRSFVAHLSEDRSTELVRTIIQLGRNLGVDVIAEGIEAPGQQRALASLGCLHGQGYWFSVPVPPERLEELVATGRLLRQPVRLPA